MKVRVERTFQYENEEIEEGTVTNLPDSVAEQAIEKGYVEKVEEEEEEKEEEETPKLEVSEESEVADDQRTEGEAAGLDVSEAKKGGGGYLSADDVSEGDEIVIKGPGEWDDTFVQDEDDEPDLVLPIELNGVEYQWRLNKTRMREFADAWGDDTGNWVGEKVIVTEPSVNYESLKETGFKVEIAG